MSDFHGIIFAYGAVPALGELVRRRTASSLPFCGRYRLIDFALSSLMNAGIHDVGVIMRRDYQSLLDHLASGKDWDMGRRIGGLRMLPPFGLPEYHRGDYTGTIEALNAVSTYIHDINAKYIIMMHGNTAANIDLRAARLCAWRMENLQRMRPAVLQAGARSFCPASIRSMAKPYMNTAAKP